MALIICCEITYFMQSARVHPYTDSYRSQTAINSLL